MKYEFNGTFYGKEQKDNRGELYQSELEIGELSYEEIRTALKKVIENKSQSELIDFILYDMFDLLNYEGQETLIGKNFETFKTAFADKIEAKDEQLAEDIENGEYDE